MRRILQCKWSAFVIGATLFLAGCAELERINADLVSSLQRISRLPEAPKNLDAPIPKSKTSPTAIASKPPLPPVINAPPQDMRAILTGNSIYAGGGGLEFAALHKPDGALVGIAWSDKGTINGSGVWRLDANGTYCRKWNNQWANGEWGCFSIERQGNRLTMRRVSGAGSDGEMTLVPGNVYGL